MRVALITEHIDLSRGGAERSTFELACALTAHDIDVTLVANTIVLNTDIKIPFQTKALAVTGSSRVSRWYCFQRAVREYCNESKPDIIHSLVPFPSAHIYQPRGGSISYSLRRHLETFPPFWSQVKGFTAGLNRARQARIRTERELCQASNGPLLAALSNYVGRQFKQEYQLPDDRIRLIRNGVNIDPFRSKEARAQGQKLRNLYSSNNDKTLFLFAAENLRLKGLTWLIRAAALAVRERLDHLRDFRIMVVSGQGFHSYWKLVHRLGLEQHVLFMGPTTQMPALLHMCDTVVLPTFNDACSRLVLEALAAGKPAITTRYNGASDFLHNGKYGCVIDQGNNTRGLTDGLMQFCVPKHQERMSFAIEADELPYQVSIQRHVRELITLYEELSVK